MDRLFHETVARIEATFTCGFIASPLDHNTCLLTSTSTDREILEQAARTRRNKILLFDSALGSNPRTMTGIAIVRKSMIQRIVLNDSIRVEAESPIARGLAVAASNNGICLVGNDPKILTRFDFAKLPFKLYCFAIIAHLEHLLQSFIPIVLGESWADCLTESDKKRATKWARKSSGPTIESASLSDKLDAFRYWARMTQIPVEGWRETHDDIYKLRNRLAHGAPLASDVAGLERLGKLVASISDTMDLVDRRLQIAQDNTRYMEWVNRPG